MVASTKLVKTGLERELDKTVAYTILPTLFCMCHKSFFLGNVTASLLDTWSSVKYTGNVNSYYRLMLQLASPIQQDYGNLL